MIPTPDERLGDGAATTARRTRPQFRRAWIWRGIQLVLGGLVLYGLLPELTNLWSDVPQLESVGWVALAFVAALQLGSWWYSSELDHTMLPGSSRFVTFTSSLATNALSRVVPAAGGALATGLTFRMWTVSGIDADAAAGAVAATTVLSLGTLFALPVVTAVLALLGAPAPKTLVWVAVGGAIAFVVLFVLGWVLLVNDRALHAVARLVERAARFVHRPAITAQRIETERNRLREVLGSRWRRGLAESTAMWAFDYLSLVAVLVALHTKPRLAFVLLAFTGAKFLAMVPVTPGGLGVVEAGLTGMLTLAGVPARAALLATLAYRVVSYWFSLPVGLVAWLAFRHRYPAVETHADTAAHA